MFDNLGDDFPFDWLVKRYFLPCFFYKRVTIPCRLYICVSGQFLPKMP